MKTPTPVQLDCLECVIERHTKADSAQGLEWKYFPFKLEVCANTFTLEKMMIKCMIIPHKKVTI